METKKINKCITVELENVNELPNNLQLLSKLDTSSYTIVYNCMYHGFIKKYKTNKGIAFDIEEYKNYLTVKNNSTKNKVYRIDTSNNSKINCLYKRLTAMNKSNRNVCQKDNRLTRYKDQNGNICINIKDYIKPQLKLLAKKLECKENLVFSKIYELLIELNKKEIK